MISADEFREQCRQSGIGPEKPLYTVLTTAFDAVTVAADAVKGGARGLTPDGEAELVRRVVNSVTAAVKDASLQHRLRLEKRSSLIAGAVAAMLAVGGFTAGHWWGWSSGQASVRVAEQQVAAAFRWGPEVARAWGEVMANNDIGQALEQCTGAALFRVNGRKACRVPLWLDGAGVPEQR